MCGIAGWTGPQGPAGRDAALLTAMGGRLARRGPDDERLVERPDFRVVFRRLAINGVNNGAQPFVVDGGRIIAAVNGEIYNHRELARRYLQDIALFSRSDCEVVVHLYRKLGAGLFEKLNGIYALVIWDEERRSLLLARDRLGVKPLYFSVLRDGVAFASELKALLLHPEVPQELDWSAFDGIPDSAFPYERPSGRPVSTGIQDVSFVAPATWVEWRDRRLHPPVTYWHPPGPGEARDPPGSIERCVDRYAELLDDSVRMQLMSEVPVGLFLSGGLDSGLIAAIASRITPSMQAFTLVEHSIASTGDPSTAQDMAHGLGMPLHLVRVDESALSETVQLDLELLEYMVCIMDFPLFDVELLFKHELHRYARKGIPDMKVILLGQGADEFAGGYSRLSSSSWAEYTENESAKFRAAVLRHRGFGAIRSQYLDSSGRQGAAQALTGSLEPWQYCRFGDLAAYNLWHEDRTASANGVEVRVPFLDHRLVEFLCSLPKEWRAELFFDKGIVRRAARRLMPSKWVRRPKVPLFPQQANHGNSIGILRRKIATCAFKSFREKYLLLANTLFSPRALEALRQQVEVPGQGDVATFTLIRCMAIAIFERMCRELRRPDFEPPSFAYAAPISTTAVPELSRVALKPANRIALNGSIKLAVSCEPHPTLLVMVCGTETASIRLPERFTERLLPAVPLWDRPLSSTELSKELGISVEAAKQLAETFIERGWATMAADCKDVTHTESDLVRR